MLDYQRMSIGEAIKRINCTLFLPDLQRTFVWDHRRVCLLFDSILRDYPIGTMLFWQLEGKDIRQLALKKLKFVSRDNEYNSEDTSISDDKEYLIVLDGQQRLTSFYLALCGCYILRNKPYDLYFNLLSGDKENEEGILYEFAFHNRDNGPSFIKCPTKREPSEKLWYKVKDICSIADPDDASDTLRNQVKEKYKKDLTEQQRRTIRRQHRYFSTEPLLYYYPEKTNDPDKVLDIFVRTNMGGVKLSYSDMLFSYLKLNWADCRDEFHNLLNSINDNNRFTFDNDFIMKVCLVLLAGDTEQSIKYRVTNFHALKVQEIKNYWNNTAIPKAIQLAIDVVKDYCHLGAAKILTSYSAVIPLIDYVFIKKYKSIGDENNCLCSNDILQIKTWLLKALLSGLFSVQDPVLYLCHKTIVNKAANGFPGHDIENALRTELNMSMTVADDFIDKSAYNASNSSLILALCYKNAINFKPVLQGNALNQDHIFSHDELKKVGIEENKINSIYNIRLVQASSNIIKSNVPYAVWVADLKERNEWAYAKECHLIPDGDWSVNKYDEFIIQRKALMISKFQY